MASLTRPLRAALALSLGCAALLPVSLASSSTTPPAQRGPAAATVIAVIDSGIAPYHWDYLAAKMPQAQSKDRRDDLPLTTSPDKWLPGFPSPKSFKSYQSLKLTLDTVDEDRALADLHEKDAQAWAGVKRSGPAGPNYYWLPGTKIIGAISFAADESVENSVSAAVFGTRAPIYDTGGGSHGNGSASVSVGNYYGTCPECLLVFLQYNDYASGNRAIEWAMNQPWIDAISNSYGFHSAGTSYTRDNVYGGANTALQRQASERGQTIFWSAGNGYENGFVTPNQTLLSSQKGPDWIITVGGTSPGSSNYTGAGKPVDLAGIGSSYLSAYGAKTVTGTGRFSGTSNATPTIAGTYGRALHLARRMLPPGTKKQVRGVIAGRPGANRCVSGRTCELSDGQLTAAELRNRLLLGATPATKGLSPGGNGNVPWAADSRFAGEGHGTYFARLRQDDSEWIAEFNRLWLPLIGKAAAPARPAGEREWMLTDSWCRQHIWGKWAGGYFVNGKTPLPALDPQKYPTRAAYQTSCNALVAPPKRPV